VGTVRAIGMTRRRVLLMFLAEALMLGFSATTCGALLGAGISAAINAAHVEVPIEALKAVLLSDTLSLSVASGQVIAAILVFTVVAALSAVGPAIRAARLQPVTAIHRGG